MVKQMGKKRSRKKSRDISAEEKRALEIANRRRAKRNARAMHDPHDHLDLMNRSEMLVARRKFIVGRVEGVIPLNTLTGLIPWQPMDRILAVIVLSGDRLLVRNPASRKKRNRRKPSSMDMYSRLPSHPLRGEDPGKETCRLLAGEAIGKGLLEARGFHETTCPATGRKVLIGVYSGTGFDPDRWGWISMPLGDPELAPEEDAMLRSALKHTNQSGD